MTTWYVCAHDKKITIPVNPDVSGYNYTVNWGDGQVTTGHTGNATHNYADAGTYTVSITGEFPAIRFGKSSSSNARKLRTIEQWGAQEWQTMRYAFWGCNYLTTESDTDAPLLAPNSSLSGMFSGCYKFNSNLSDWDVSEVIDMSHMFNSAENFNQDIGNWNVSQVKNMGGMFYGAKHFNQDIGDWEVGQVTNMAEMFWWATSFNLDTGDWEVSHVTDMSYMFYGASSFNQDIGS